MERKSAFSGNAIVCDDRCTPSGVAASVSGTGSIVVDHFNHKLKRFSTAGLFEGLVGIDKLDNIPWQFPYKIAADRIRLLYVVLERMDEMSLGSIKRIDEHGVLQVVYPRPLPCPVGVTVDTEGRIIVVCRTSPVSLYMENGNEFYSTNLMDTILNPVAFVAIHEELFICDAGDNIMKVYSYNGVLKRTFALKAESPFAARLNVSEQIVVGSHNPDQAEGILKVFELDGTELASRKFSVGVGPCLDMDCFGDHLVYISSSDGVIQIFNYKNNGDMDESFESATPPNSPGAPHGSPGGPMEMAF